MRAMLGYGISIIRHSQEYADLLSQYPWLAVDQDDYMNAEAIMNDAIEEELEAAIWSCRDTKDGILISSRGCLSIKDEADYENGEISLLPYEALDDNDIITFCGTIGREPEWILLCVE